MKKLMLKLLPRFAVDKIIRNQVMVSDMHDFTFHEELPAKS